jgi:S1-C subfamily serine protease
MALSGDTTDTGVLADPNGAVAGLVIGTADGRSLAYGSDMLTSLLDRLRTGGTIEHPWIGVRAGDVPVPGQGATTPVGETPPSDPVMGALVFDVIPGSPAEASGVIAGDLVTSVAGQPVHDMGDLLEAVAPLSPGDVVTVELFREGAPIRLSIQVATFPG